MKQSQSLIYLDANATTPVLPAAAKAAMDAMEHLYGNPSSSHITGLQAKALMEQTRQAARKHLGSGAGKLVFTSGATEGIQTAILSALIAARDNSSANKTADERACLLYGATEHKAVPESLRHWNKVLGINARVLAIPVDREGRLDLDFIAAHGAYALLICTMAVNNETGVYQDLPALERAIRSANPQAFWMVDCVQALGKLPLELAATSIDYAPFSGHKLYAPKGIGMLYIRDGAPFTPFIAGGGQEGGLRSGTENLPAMAALKVVLDMLNGDANDRFADHATLINYRLKLIAALQSAFGEIVLNHSLNNSVPTTLNFAVPGFSSKEIMDLFDAADIRVSSGSACSSKVTGSFVLDAMGLPRWQSESAIRLSFGPAICDSEIDAACERIIRAAGSLRHSCLLARDSKLDDGSRTPLSGLLQFKDDGACCWLYVEPQSRSAVIIDPLPALEQRLLGIIRCQELTLRAVVDTHGHGDHSSNREGLVAKLGLNGETDHLGWPADCETIELQGCHVEALSLGNQQLVRIESPGHTDDSITLAMLDSAGKVLFAFVGDTVLPGSIGRSNFPQSSTGALYQSLKIMHKLLGNDTLLLSSHDYHNDFFTNFAVEAAQNPLLAAVLGGAMDQAQFVSEKAAMDATLNDKAGETIMCGAYSQCGSTKGVKEYSTDSLEQLLRDNSDALVLDIREPHEYELSHRESRCINVPLTRLAGFVASEPQARSKPLVLICRSGSRSLVAARALERFGFSAIAHVAGGYALLGNRTRNAA
ncbi:aminotransferase class V-fold PLP-dependent enzyme [Shewanella sp. JM162201]|uniref:cysteine desulfurase n=1 Tax=Shewanella jiangmenensis TaxID=2837387 RepID=A0ABS5V5L5_9GAMM|nr:aminotransferase class V-fold PLP-dependent enzyme [Shewanella jiangmenensis]MBT1445749.1 aminotransferase class V-fold PLP-dependent enzyme [Shewanella jiangmenensis]